MDYSQLNLLFGLILIFALMVEMSLRVLLSKFDLPAWMSTLSWVALALSVLSALYLSVLSALYIEVLFLQHMTPSFNRQIGLGLLVIGGAVALLYRMEISSPAAGLWFRAQLIASLLCLALAFGLYQRLVPMPGL